MKSKQIKTTKEQTQYSERCPVCNKEIIGTSEGMVKYNMKVHCMQIHNMLVNIKPLPKEESNKVMLNKTKEKIKHG